MNGFKKRLIIFAFLLLIFLVPLTTLAQTNNNLPLAIKYESVNLKDGSRYFFKRATEKMMLFILSYNSQKKINYYEKLLNVRLAELKYIVDNKDIGNIQVASQRYFTTAGQLTNSLISKSKLSPHKENVKKLFEEHIKVIETLKITYSDTSAEWRFLRDDVNYLIDYSALLNQE